MEWSMSRADHMLREGKMARKEACSTWREGGKGGRKEGRVGWVSEVRGMEEEREEWSMSRADHGLREGKEARKEASSTWEEGGREGKVKEV